MTLTITNIITFISMYPIAFILYYFQKSTVKRFGVCIWLMLDEFTPIKLSLQKETLVAEHIETEFTIPLEDIASLTIIEELPRIRKVNGTGLSNLSAGTFRNSAEGKVKVLLNPKLELFLRVETEDTIYYFSGYSDEVTQEVYENLTQVLPINTAVQFP